MTDEELNANAAALARTSEPVNPIPPATVETLVGVPVAESGSSTSEWKVTIMAMVTNTIALAVAFGLRLTAEQQAAILAFVGSTTALVGLYAVSRGVRKRGTSG